jgi:cyclopropane fatty-acyl-phospholipid synthase-like methyltransferase
MYNDIVDIYNEIFPLNHAFLKFIPTYLGSPGSRVLDLGCGPGEYVDELYQSHYDVTGIDSSSEMIRYAQKAKKGAFFNFSFTEIRNLDGRFDCAFCIGNSLSYLPENRLKGFFKEIKELLNDNGYLLIQVVNWDKYRQTGTMEFPLKTLADGRTFHRGYERTGKSTVIFQTEIRKDGNILNSWSDPLYPKYVDNVRQDMTDSKMTIVDVFGDFEKSPFDPSSSPATILVAQKQPDDKAVNG